MTRIDPANLSATDIAQALLSAPAWARIGITAPGRYIREEAALELARAVLLQGGEEGRMEEPGQLRLGL